MTRFISSIISLIINVIPNPSPNPNSNIYNTNCRRRLPSLAIKVVNHSLHIDVDVAMNA